MLKWSLRGLGFAVLVLIAVIAVRTGQYRPAPVAENEPFAFGADLDKAVRDLSAAVTFRTVSTDMTRPDFRAFLGWMETTWPQVFATMERVVLDPATPLYIWQGRDDTLPPILLAAHYDVVPVAPVALDQWAYPPYAGVVADGFVWGRGTLDNKGALVAIMTAAEQLIGEGFTPQRTIYLSFGGDEETGGTGAQAVADFLTARSQRLGWALDEGSFVLDRIIPGLDVPVASINIAEKGYVTMTLVATGAGGHSSMPPRETAVGKLATAVAKLQATPVPGGLTGVSEEFFDALGRYFSIEKRAIFANRWLFEPLLEGILAGAPSTDAMLRTTTAPTMLSGSPKENVLAQRATATINFRIHPRDSIDDIVAHVRDTIDDDSIEIEMNRDFASPASPVSDSSGPGYLAIEASIRATFGPIASVPGLTIAATDARHYATAADGAYRINPFRITADDLTRFHGVNERLSVENLEKGITFYGSLMSGL